MPRHRACFTLRTAFQVASFVDLPRVVRVSDLCRRLNSTSRNPSTGVAREALEETGIHVEVDELTGVHKNMTRGIVALVFR